MRRRDENGLIEKTGQRVLPVEKDVKILIMAISMS
jgi:hypothetical protein